MENEEIMEEDFLSNDASGEDDISSAATNTLEDKLDHIEALLNEDITLRTTSSGVEEVEEEVITSSGVEVPNYTQYIYDYLSDSTVKVEIVGEKGIFEKQLNDYNVVESIGVISLFIAFGFIVGVFVNRFTFKRR